jgi:hypothetical protein
MQVTSAKIATEGLWPKTVVAFDEFVEIFSEVDKGRDSVEVEEVEVVKLATNSSRLTSHFQRKQTNFGLSSIIGQLGGYDGVEQPDSRNVGQRFLVPNSSQWVQ